MVFFAVHLFPVVRHPGRSRLRPGTKKLSAASLAGGA